MKLKYEDLPIDWQVCFLGQCRLKDSCLRYQGGLTLPDNIYSANAVTPNALAADPCPMFMKTDTVRAALGFSHIFDEVKARHAPVMRARLTEYLGGNGTYYRYMHGERPLMPEQQEWICQLFKNYGYTDAVVFDNYTEAFRFYND